MRAVCKLQEAARHSKQEDAWNHGYHGSKADGRKRHVPAARDRSEDHPDDETRDEGAGRGAGAEHGERHPPERVGHHADGHRPAYTAAWRKRRSTYSLIFFKFGFVP